MAAYNAVYKHLPCNICSRRDFEMAVVLFLFSTHCTLYGVLAFNAKLTVTTFAGRTDVVFKING
jgi:hypothetical protein